MSRRPRSRPSSPAGEATAQPPVDSAAPRARWREALPVVVIVALALALRLWGILWGMPHDQDISTYHPDEAVNLFYGVLDRGVARPHIDLGMYNYGGLYFYLWQAAVAINQTYGLLALHRGALVQPGGTATLTVGTLILVGRLLTVLAGGLMVWAVYAAGARLFARQAGILAAALLAVAPLAVVHGHFATVDVTATLMVTLALWCGARAITGGSLRDLALAGLCSGLAAATKYNCGLVVCAALAAVFLRAGDARARVRGVALVLGAAVVGFVVGCPGALVDPSRFLADVRFEAVKSQQGVGALFANTGNGYVYPITVSLRYGLAMPLLLLTIAAVVHAIVRRERGTWLLAAFLVPYYLVIGYAQVRYIRYVLPMLPAMMLLAGRTLTLQLPYRTRVSRALSGIGAIVLVTTLLISSALDRQMARPDARDRARDWIYANVPRGRTIAFATTPFYYTPRLIPAFGAPVPVDTRRRLILAAKTPWVFRLPADDSAWDTSVLAPPPPDCVLVTNFETEDAVRLHDRRALAWLGAARAQYVPVVFDDVPSVLGVSLGMPAWLPNDWLYIMPRVTLYMRR